MKRRNGSESRGGEKSLRDLKLKYENTINYTQCDLAEDLIEENISRQLKRHTPILARLATETTKRNELGWACKRMVELIRYEIRNIGYDIVAASESEEIRAWKNFLDKRNIFEIINYEITCPNEKVKDVKQKIERRLLDLYGLRIKFNSPS